MDPRAGVEKRKISCPRRESKPQLSLYPTVNILGLQNEDQSVKAEYINNCLYLELVNATNLVQNEESCWKQTEFPNVALKCKG